MSDDLSILRRKLLYRSWHRGTREMDMIMGSFAELYLSGYDAGALATYEDILNEQDPDLYDWISGRAPLPADKDSSVMQALLRHSPAGLVRGA